ncbi:4-hydroxybenzoate polyprenyltransferase, mitochondrial-like isoform X2 [Ostrea edulis]|uniref:4-hydroxybenzoate polyprenyltransferase, mitochondrial-like isoform X2 n=1 Tax=Ostrea edulis TaxID=37623 RepID=UPI0024AF6C0D|nr:4-hydroxybenzoate polyprenyltransferase, mitochondrial-like isoform X2 [Ostrea edulis]XP_056000848.1 4-hydroxybenzoate polyprenyltransferase, mitochondrial-like isoform X2 [Ostrea edulis]
MQGNSRMLNIAKMQRLQWNSLCSKQLPIALANFSHLQSVHVGLLENKFNNSKLHCRRYRHVMPSMLKNQNRTCCENLTEKSVCVALPTDKVLWRQCCEFHAMNLNSRGEKASIGNTHCLKNVINIQRRHFNLSPQGILTASPSGLQPYLRLIRFDKPIGTWLLFWPCTWSIALATAPGSLPSLWLLGLFGAGSFFMRGAGCIINDMWDKDYDRRVERTKLRPLASGELTQFQGLMCLASMLSVSLGILLQLNWYSVVLGAASMGLVITYPLAKRYTFWPQALLGVTLNWGVLIAWSGIHGCLQTTVIPLYLACVLYTIFYDTIYSHQDKYDDMLIGVKSTALKFGDQTKVWLTGFGTAMVSLLALSGKMCDQTWPYYTAVSLTAAHIAHQLYTVDLDNPDDCARKFRSNTQLGFVMFLGIVLGTLLKKEEGTSNKTLEEN